MAVYAALADARTGGNLVDQDQVKVLFSEQFRGNA